MKQTNFLIDMKSFTTDSLIQRKIENNKKQKNYSRKNSKFSLSQSNNTSVSNFRSFEKKMDSSNSENKNCFVNKFNSKSFRKINQSHHHIINFCEGECRSDCKNLEIIKNLEFKIKELLIVNDQIKKINDFLLLSLQKNEDLYVKVTKDNFNLKGNILSEKNLIFMKNHKTLDYHNNPKAEQANANSLKFKKREHDNDAFSKIIKNLKINSIKYCIKKDFNKNKNGVNDENIVKIERNKKMIIHNDTELDKNFNKDSKICAKTLKLNFKNIFPLNKQKDELNEITTDKFQNNLNEKGNSQSTFSEKEMALEHYDRLSEMGELFTHRRYTRQQNAKSFMSDEELERNLFKDCNKLESILFKDEYIEEIRSSDVKLYSMLDSYAKIIKDFQFAIQSIKKLKHLLKSSIVIVNSFFQSEDEASKNLIKVACEMLECERSTIFLFDSCRNQLVQFIGNDLQRNQIKVAKNKGIVSACFNSGERIVVNNAYADKRFCIEFDKNTGYITKTVLCSPIKDNYGVIIGVLQSLNKITGIFTSDDEEIHDILSAYGSCILNKTQTNQLNQSEYTVSKLKKLINFMLELDLIRNKIDLTIQIENLLMNIFHTDKVKFYFHEKQESFIERILRDRIENKIIIGIIKHVIENKKLYLCKSLQDPYYNDLVDIHTAHCILTYPIISNNDLSVLAVFQLSYENINVFKQNICEMDVFMINVINSTVSEWIINMKSKTGK